MTWSILGVTIDFKRFKIMRSYARGGSEERSELLFRTAFFASASRFRPPVLQSTLSYPWLL